MWTVLILFLVGISLVVAEFIVPGAVLGILGGACILISVIYGWIQFPEYGLFIALGEFIGLFLGVIGGLYILSNTKVSRRLVMNKAQTKDEGFSSPGEDPALVGRYGTVYSALRPAGAIIVDGRRISAVSDGTFIDKDARVRVIDVEGYRVVVEPAPEMADTTEEAAT